jgi:methanol metabolism-related c-type cytochrome
MQASVLGIGARRGGFSAPYNRSLSIDKKMGKRVKSLGNGMIAAAGIGLMILNSGSAFAEAPAAAPPIPTEKTAGASSALPDPALHKAAQEGKKWEAGRWVLPDGSPTYNVERGADNTDAVKMVDWMTYSGWRRYHAECHVCHGPNAEGSSFAPALHDSLKTMDYAKFLQVVASGQIRDVAGTKYIMPALGDNKNVMCYIDDLYVYLKARATDALPGGRISADQRAEKPVEAIEAEKACIGD